MTCKTCDNKGFVHSEVLKDNTSYPMLMKCPNPNCPHESKYYKAIKDRYSNNISEQVLPNKQGPDQALQDSKDHEPTANTHVNVSVSQVDLQDEQLISDKIDESLSSARQNSTPGMDSVYPNVPADLANYYRDGVKKDPDFQLVLQTPWGNKVLKSLREADRLLGIINKYSIHYDHLSKIDKVKNVTVFPINKSLGFD